MRRRASSSSIGDCDGLYISNGENYSTIPGQQFTRTTWLAVELGHAFQRTFRVTADHLVTHGNQWMPMLRVGTSTVSAKITPSRFPGKVQLSFTLIPQKGSITYGLPTLIKLGASDEVVVITDPVKHLVKITINGLGLTFLTKTVDQVEPVSVRPGVIHSQGTPSAVSSVDVTDSTPPPRLCQSLVG